MGRKNGAVEEKRILRFTDNGDGTVTDNKSGLVWVKNPHTDLPDQFKDRMTLKEAIQACKKLKFAGKNDWRLPTVEELRELVDYTRGVGNEPAIDTKVFPDTKTSWYLTSTPVVWSTDTVWYVGFLYGSVLCDYEDNDYYVRPVRSSQ